MICPKCASGETCYVRKLGNYPFPLVGQILHAILAMLWQISRRHLYRCTACESEFRKHTAGSLIALILLIVYSVLTLLAFGLTALSVVLLFLG